MGQSRENLCRSLKTWIIQYIAACLAFAFGDKRVYGLLAWNSILIGMFSFIVCQHAKSPSENPSRLGHTNLVCYIRGGTSENHAPYTLKLTINISFSVIFWGFNAFQLSTYVMLNYIKLGLMSINTPFPSLKNHHLIYPTHNNFSSLRVKFTISNRQQTLIFV